MPLYGRIRPKHRTTGLRPVARQLGGQARARRRAPARCSRTPWGITCTRARVDAELAAQAPAAVLGVHDDRVEAVVQPPLRCALARRAARAAGCRGRSAPAAVRAPRRRSGSRRRRAAARRATGSARRRPRARRGGSASMSGTCSASLTARRARAPRAAAAQRGRSSRGARSRPRRGTGAVARSGSCTARPRRPARASARAQRVVVGRRVGRGVDDVDAHGTDNRRAWARM